MITADGFYVLTCLYCIAVRKNSKKYTSYEFQCTEGLLHRFELISNRISACVNFCLYIYNRSSRDSLVV
jgi:hypothetical protein